MIYAIVLFGHSFDDYWFWHIAFDIPLAVVVLKLLKILWLYHFGRTMIDYNNPYGASELRRDRNPSFFRLGNGRAGGFTRFVRERKNKE